MQPAQLLLAPLARWCRGVREQPRVRGECALRIRAACLVEFLEDLAATMARRRFTGRSGHLLPSQERGPAGAAPLSTVVDRALVMETFAGRLRGGRQRRPAPPLVEGAAGLAARLAGLVMAPAENTCPGRRPLPARPSRPDQFAHARAHGTSLSQGIAGGRPHSDTEPWTRNGRRRTSQGRLS